VTELAYPIEPLLKCIEEPGEDVAVARTLGVPWSTLKRWRENGLRPLAADRVAVHIGKHPFEIWPSWFDDLELEQTCGWCGEVVMRDTCERRFCSRAHYLLVAAERSHDRLRLKNWWRRLDRYRESVVEMAEAA
jgi:hypothetical protein